VQILLYTLLYIVLFLAGFALSDGTLVCESSVYQNYYGLCP
jgi:hypothetical protein